MSCYTFPPLEFLAGTSIQTLQSPRLNTTNSKSILLYLGEKVDLKACGYSLICYHSNLSDFHGPSDEVEIKTKVLKELGVQQVFPNLFTGVFTGKIMIHSSHHDCTFFTGMCSPEPELTTTTTVSTTSAHYYHQYC